MTGFIDYADGRVSFYVFDKKDKRYTLVDTVSVPVEGELNQSILTSLVKINIEHVYLSIPASLLSMRELSFPFPDKNKIKDAIPFELEGILLRDTGDYSIDHLVTESSESSSSVLAACMEKTKLRDIIDLFSSVGLEPVVITSIDLRLCGKNIDKLFEGPFAGEEIRAEAAAEELVNPSINLRQNELAYKGDIERIKKSLRLTGALVLLLLLILGSAITLKLISFKKEHALITKAMNTVYLDTFPSETKIFDTVRQFKGNLNLLKEKKNIFVGVPALDILLNIANIKNENITLSELNIDRKNIVIKGTARSFENVDSFKNALSSLFRDVRVIDSRSSSEKKISFSIIMKVYDS